MQDFSRGGGGRRCGAIVRYTDREGLEAFNLSKTGVSRGGGGVQHPPPPRHAPVYIYQSEQLDEVNGYSDNIIVLVTGLSFGRAIFIYFTREMGSFIFSTSG